LSAHKLFFARIRAKLETKSSQTKSMTFSLYSLDVGLEKKK